jgi:glycosyltransferase involved in cell wall biosynthesis
MNWLLLQKQRDFPLQLKEFFPWPFVAHGTQVKRDVQVGVETIALPEECEQVLEIPQDLNLLGRFIKRMARDIYPETPSLLHYEITCKALENLEKLFPLRPGMHVLDVGCGQGPALEYFSSHKLEYLGITLSEEDIAVCRAKGYRVEKMDQSFLAVPEGSQDLVWARHVIEHSLFPLFTLEGFSRILRPGGLLYLEAPAPETSCHHERNPNHYSVLPKGCWRALLERCGFKILGDVDYSFEVPAGPDMYWGFYCQKIETGRASFAASNSLAKKMLFYYDGLHNIGTPFAGASTAILGLAEKLAKIQNNFSIDITGNYITRDEHYRGIRFLALPTLDQCDLFLSHYDVVIFSVHLVFFNTTKKKPGASWVLYLHSWDIEPQELSRLGDFDLFICLSQQQAKHIIAQGVPPSKLAIIPNGVNTNCFKPITISRKAHSILFAGAVVPHKAVHILIEAFESLRGQIFDAELHIYGNAGMWYDNGTYENHLKKLCIDNVFFHDPVSHEEMPAIYSRHSVLCLPSLMESFGLVTVEAQACGCIPVIHDVGGTSSTLDNGKTGFLYSPNTPQALAQALLKAFETIEDDPQIRSRAIEFVRNNFSMETLAHNFIKNILFKDQATFNLAGDLRQKGLS